MKRTLLSVFPLLAPVLALAGPPASTAPASCIASANGCANLDANAQLPLSLMMNVNSRNGLRIARIGDSRIGNSAVAATVAGGGYTYPVWLYTSSDYLSFANALTGGRLNTDPVAYGYSGGIFRSLQKVVVGAGGAHYSAADTVTTNCPGATLGAPVLSNGAIVSVPVTNAGTGACAQPATLTITTSTGSGAILVPVVQGLGTFGQGGENACSTQYRMPDVTSSNADVVLIEDGTNDIGNGATAAAAVACVENMIEQVVLSGKRVILGNNLPRGAASGVGYITSTQGSYLNALDRSLREWASGIGNSDPRYQGVALLDVSRECTDATSTAGYPLEVYSATLPDCMPDGLHLGYGGAVIFAQKLLATLQSWGISFAPASNLSPYDAYNATTNPGGYVNSNPLMTGTGGTASSGCTGTVATDFSVSLVAGTSNATCTASIESTRSDGFSGRRQQIVVGSTTGGGTIANYKIAEAHSLATFGLSVGMPIYLEADVEVDNSVKMTLLELDITFYNSSSAVIQDCAWGAAYGTQGYYADTGSMGALSASTPLHPITPRGPSVCTIPTGTVNIAPSLEIGADFSGAANSAAFTVKLGNFTLRPFSY